LSTAAGAPAKADRRLDQWLWFARLAKSRSLAARLCTAGAVVVNGTAARKASQVIRIGDAVVLQQGPRRRTVRVRALGTRRGPATDAQTLYEEVTWPEAMPAPAALWTPLLVDDALAGPGGDAES
jgi:ribosome-associated heat shock protein Hsp15